VAQLEGVIARNPQHIGAIHYYIHAVEASKTPERAEAPADTLGTLAPGSGHLVHMPAHVYIRVGRYNDATLANLSASKADKAFLAVCSGSNGAYPLGYVPHNWHFAAMSAGLQGSRTLAQQAADQTAQRAVRDQLDAGNFMQRVIGSRLCAEVRFGQWETILAQPAPPGDRPFPTAIWHFARGMANVRTGDLQAARIELTALDKIASDPAMEKLVLADINRADRILGVASNLLRGELEIADGKPDAGIASLREAAKIEDTLNYTEPADWPLPVRMYLGAALLDAKRPREAAEVYRQDLATYPKNGWALYGLAQAQRAMGDAKAAAQTDAQQKAAWQWADTTLTASRF
jgi:tetratricopeptide (TPR) repeat protein